MKTKKPVIPAILGPTASGKTAIAVEIARDLGMEIISCDSRQIYRFMNIGTAKPLKEQLGSAVHHCIDLVDPDKQFSAYLYSEEASAVILKGLIEGKKFLLCGGTGLYYRSLCEGLWPRVESDPRLRDELIRRAKAEGSAALHLELIAKDPASASRIHENDTQRIVRALLVYYQTGRSLSSSTGPNPGDAPFEFRAAVLNVKRDVLYERIGARVDQMIQAGLYEEYGELLHRGYGPLDPGLHCVGYKELAAVEQGCVTLSEAAELIKMNTRRYAKRQVTWFTHQTKGIPIDHNAFARIRDFVAGTAGL